MTMSPLKVEKQTHHGVVVSVEVHMEKMRKYKCLCLNCAYIEACEWAKKLYEACKDGNIALAITRCSGWGKK